MTRSLLWKLLGINVLVIVFVILIVWLAINYLAAGIGLAIVKELIEAHNGHVGAEISNDEIRIWFSLPA